MPSSSDLGKLDILLGQDVSEQYKLLLSEDSPMLRRSFVRSFFAYVEGITYVLKRDALSLVRIQSGVYSPGEISILTEENYGINNRGELTKQRKFLPTAENFLFAMKMFLKTIPNVDVDIQVGSKEWQHFITALQIRHRIVHPKQELDLEISDDEKKLLLAVSVWFNYIIISKLVEAVRSLDKLYRENQRQES